MNDSKGFCFIFYLHLLVEGLRDTSQVHRWYKLLHGRQLSICQLTILCSDPIHNQSKFLLLQTKYDLQATQPPYTAIKYLALWHEWRHGTVAVIRYETTDRVPLPIIVLLPVEDLLLFAHRQPDPAFRNVQGKMRVPSSGSSKEQQSLSSSSPHIQRKVGPAEVKTASSCVLTLI